MHSFIKIVFFCLAITLSHQVIAENKIVFRTDAFMSQDDSTRTRLISKTLNSNLQQLRNKASDSIEIFQNVSLMYAELENAEDAEVYARKYIINSADLSILNKDSFNKIRESQEFKSLKSEYAVKINVLVLIYLYIAFIGFFFAFIINFKKSSDTFSNFLIGGFVVVHSLFIIDFALYYSNIRYYLPHVYLMSASVSLLYGPFLYFYFKRLTQQYRFKKKDLIHAVPFIILLAVLVPFYQISADEKLNIMFGLSDQFTNDRLFYTVFIPKLLSYIIYGALIRRLYFMEKKKFVADKNYDLFKWKRNIYNIHVFYLVSYAIYGISIKGIFIEQSNLIYHSQMLSMSFMVLYIAQMAYVRPKLFDYKTIMKVPDYLSYHKYSKSGLTESLSEELKSNLLQLLMVEKVYTDSSLNLEKLSSKLETTRHNASQIINEHFNMNFFELINKFRIEEAKHLLNKDINGNLNIIDIAYEVGYNNKVTFNKAFKKETSLTPTQYINSLKSGNSSRKPKGIFSRA